MRFSTLWPALGVLIAVALFLPADVARGDAGRHYGSDLQGFDYPWPVRYFRFNSQDLALDMAYMDIMRAKPNGRTAVLLHGKNFCAATWQRTAISLRDAGYRVIAPDQIGFCKSTKPSHYQFSFQ